MSSTRIRESLARGRRRGGRRAPRAAATSWTAESSAGTGRGRTLGIPTANLAVGQRDPAQDGRLRGPGRASAEAARCAPRSSTSAAGRPSAAERATVEAHLLDFEGDLYGRRLRVFFVARLRDERPFAGPEALVRPDPGGRPRGPGVLAGGADGL